MTPASEVDQDALAADWGLALEAEGVADGSAGQRPSDLDGSGGLYRMRDELTRRINTMIAPNRINAVLFKEVVVQ